MTSPCGFRAESFRSPKASRAGALHSTLLHATQRHANPVVTHVCGVSGYDQIQSNGDLRSLAAPIGFGANR
jgi:hypothetical protein